MTDNPIFCALDTQEKGEATTLAARVADSVGGLKLGLEFFVANGPKGVKQVSKASELPLFLDLKFHDIPNTVAGAVRSVVPFKPYFLTVHTAGGLEMMRAAVRAAHEEADRLVVTRPRVLGVTVLTSLDRQNLDGAGVSGSVEDQVLRLALLAREAGLDGVVCSSHEVATLRAECGTDFKLVVPGIRPGWMQRPGDDQKRVMTPEEAIDAGADVLVIGRPITAQTDPAAAAKRICEEIEVARARPPAQPDESASP